MSLWKMRHFLQTLPAFFDNFLDGSLVICLDSAPSTLAILMWIHVYSDASRRATIVRACTSGVIRGQQKMKFTFIEARKETHAIWNKGVPGVFVADVFSL